MGDGLNINPSYASEDRRRVRPDISQEDELSPSSFEEGSPEPRYLNQQQEVNCDCNCQSSFDFIFTGLLLIVSSTALNIMFPAYTKLTTGTPIMYVFPSTMTLFFISGYVFFMKRCGFMDPYLFCPLKLTRLLQIVGTLGGSMVVIIYSQIGDRVACHMQDPLKSILIVFALLFYFLLCKKMLGVRKLFATAILSIGLFITADYGLCNDFKCRGAKSVKGSKWEFNLLWNLAYSIGLGAFALAFTFLEDHIIYRPLEKLFCPASTVFMSTVSKLVSNNETSGTICHCKPPNKCEGNIIEEMGPENVYNIDDPADVYPENTANCPESPTYEPVYANVESYLNELKKSSIMITMWIQAFLCVLLFIVASVFYLNSAVQVWITNSTSIDTYDIITCHIPGAAVGDEPIMVEVPKQLGEIDTTQTTFENLSDSPNPLDFDGSDDMDDINTVFEKREVGVSIKPRSKRSTRERTLMSNTHKRNGRVHRSKHVKRHNMNSANVIAYNKTSEPIPLTQLNSTMQNKLYENRCNDTKNAELIKANSDNSTRNKRTSVQTNALGFKIIQPTDSILQGHVITNKLKPDLVGHVILNKTSVNLNGHTITFKQDLFIREHDPQSPKMHRMHRGRLDHRFANDLMNSTDVVNVPSKPASNVSNVNHGTTSESNEKARHKREIERNNAMIKNYVDNNYMDNDVNVKTKVDTVSIKPTPNVDANAHDTKETNDVDNSYMENDINLKENEAVAEDKSVITMIVYVEEKPEDNVIPEPKTYVMSKNTHYINQQQIESEMDNEISKDYGSVTEIVSETTVDKNDINNYHEDTVEVDKLEPNLAHVEGDPTNNVEISSQNLNDTNPFENYNYSNWKLFQSGRNIGRKEKKYEDNKPVNITRSDRLKIFNMDDGKHERQVVKYGVSEAKKVISVAEDKVIEDVKPPIPEPICHYIPVYGWGMVIAYTAFSVTSVRFLILSQSSVFTIAMMAPALPLSEIWWTLFAEKPDGNLVWNMNIGADLLCALLGLPIIIAGLVLFFRAHIWQTYVFAVNHNVPSGSYTIMEDGENDYDEDMNDNANTYDIDREIYTV